MPDPPQPPVIAIVVPLFKHSVLVVDALESVIRQKSRYPFIIIVVNDGCPFQESDLQIKSVLAVHPDIIRYVVRPNGGLSAARNTGINYALAQFSSIQAIYFMDADNAILPGTIDAAYSKLMEEPEHSWIYPNIDMFGIRRNFDYSGPYSILRHTLDNICEAGSLVHRRVFDAGIRFDEKMKLGYEDWDFWLTAATRGFRGAQHPYFGFRYRNRGESMLSHAQRDRFEIRAYMERKHPSLLGRRGLLRLESIEAPRYAIIFTDTNDVLVTTGSPESATLISQAEFEERLWRNMVVPTWQHIPPFVVLLTRATFDHLSRQGLTLWVLHEGELALKEMNFFGLIVDMKPGPVLEIKPGGRASESDVFVVGRELIRAVVRDASTQWIEGIVAPQAEMKMLTKTMTVPNKPVASAIPRRAVVFDFLVKVLAWRASRYRAAADRSWIWRDISVPLPHSLYANVRAAFGDEVAYPRTLSTDTNIGFVLPIASVGGVERAAYNVARQFKQAGWLTHLFVVGQTRVEIPRELADAFTSINFLNDPGFGGWDPGSAYQGTVLPAVRNNRHATNRIVAALAWLDAVVNCHCLEFNAAAADLRRLGVTTITHLQLLDLSPAGKLVGHPVITLAYEHAYDMILCCSKQLVAWMHGAGIPYEKLLHVPNAPGHPVDPAKQEQILLRRRSSTSQSLNILYLGRLDRQKGLDRLADVIQQTRDLELPVNWRIVGSRVIGDSATPLVLRELLEPAVFESEQLTSLFSWADVMVLLSDYEGVPLSVLEAQRLGVIVIATNVGALSEAVSPGRTGFLTEPETAVEQTVALLRFLNEVPSLRSEIAAAASQVVDWPEATAEFMNRLTKLVESRRSAETPAASRKESKPIHEE